MYASIPIAAMQDRSWPGTKGRLARELRHKVVCGVCICVCVCVCDGKGAGLMGRVTGHVAD
jgi:hypothetical protein